MPYVIDVPSYGFGIHTFKDWIFVFGGKDSAGRSTNNVSKLNVRTGEIVTLNPMTTNWKIIRCVSEASERKINKISHWQKCWTICGRFATSWMRSMRAMLFMSFAFVSNYVLES